MNDYDDNEYKKCVKYLKKMDKLMIGGVNL